MGSEEALELQRDDLPGVGHEEVDANHADREKLRGDLEEVEM